MLSVVRRYQEAASHSSDSLRIRAVPKQKFLTVAPAEHPRNTARAVLYFAAWHARTLGPVFVLGAPAELLAFWALLHETVDDLAARRNLAFREGRLDYVGKQGTWTVMAGLTTTPSGLGDGDLLYSVPAEEKALWVFLDWTTVPQVFLAQAPLGLVVQRWMVPALL